MAEAQSMKIDELFSREISRDINRVVKVGDEDRDIVQQELEEYVLTSLLEKHFKDVLEAVRESEHKSQDDPGIWISGFFGSGKSHFMKILGYLLEDEEFGGHTATDIFKRRTVDETLKGTVDVISSKFECEVLMFQIGAYEDKSAGGEDISQIILRQFNKDLGFAGTPWIADIERDLKSRGKYEEFKGVIEEQTGGDWNEKRTEATFVRKDIEKALTEIIPDFDEGDAERAIDNVQDEVVTADSVTNKIVDYVEEREQETGEDFRYFVFLDEISQFIGEDKDKLLELQSLVEKFGTEGGGKLWLGVTSQEQLDVLLPGVLANEKEEQKVGDRFPQRYDLTAQDLDQVVRERILQKREGVKPELTEFYEDREGMINTRYKLENSRNAGRIDEEKFVECYPFLPYQLEVLPDIFSALRGTGESELTGTERTLIDVTHSIFNPPHNLREEDVGKVVTLDMIFDEIKGEMNDQDVKTIEEASPEGIDEELARRVLKALYLIQQLSWIPDTAENVATALYPEIGDVSIFEEGVDRALKGMTGSYVGESDNGYRFLSQGERDIEKEIASVDVKQGDIRRWTKKTLRDEVFDKADKVNYEGNSFDVSLEVDDNTVSDDGEIELVAYSSVHQEYEDIDEKKMMNRSHSEEGKIYWVADTTGGSLVDSIERAHQIEYVVDDKKKKKLSEEEEEAVDQKQEDLQRLKNKIKKELTDAFTKGTIIYNGDDTQIDDSGARIEKVVERHAEEAIQHVFTELDDGLADVRDKDLEAVFEDIENRSLPGVFEELSLVVDGELNPEAAVCSEIEDEIDRRRNAGEDTTGKAILEEFGSAPYGWDRNVVRIGVAVLFRNGSLVPTHQEKQYSSYKESGAQDLFTSIRKFKRTSFEEKETIDAETRMEAKQLLKKLFDENVKNTIKDISDGIEEAATGWANRCSDIQPELRRCSFPLQEEFSNLETHLTSIEAKDTHAGTIRAFLGKQDEIEPLIKTAKKVFEFEESGKLEEYKKYRDFLDDEWGEYVDVAEDSDRVEIDDEAESAARDLRDALDSEEIIENWSKAKTKHGEVANEYAETYEELYERRHEVYDDAIEEVKTYAEGLDDEEVEGVLGSLKSRRGEASVDIGISDDDHLGRSLDIETINEQINAVDVHIQNAKDKVDDIRSKDGNGVETVSVSAGSVLSDKVVEDESDLQDALGALEDRVLQELESEQEVEVRFK